MCIRDRGNGDGCIMRRMNGRKSLNRLKPTLGSYTRKRKIKKKMLKYFIPIKHNRGVFINVQHLRRGVAA